MLPMPAGYFPESSNWSHEVKLDGYRALAIRTAGGVQLRSRNNKDFNRYPAVAKALGCQPDQTVVDGELIALDGAGRPSFNALQNFDSAQTVIAYYVFDVLVLLGGRDLTLLPLTERRELMRVPILLLLSERVRESPVMDASLSDLVAAVRAQGLEGLVAKRLDSRYEPGERSGAWQKMRTNRSQEFVIGGYTPGARNFDALIFGYFDGDRLIYVGRTRSGFTPASRGKLWRLFRGLEVAECPFVNLPEAHAGRWGQGLTAEKMLECRWLAPVLVAQFEFVEWTPDGHLRHVKFVAMREDKEAREVGRE